MPIHLIAPKYVILRNTAKYIQFIKTQVMR